MKVKHQFHSQNLLKAVLEMNHMQMQDLIDYSDPDEGGDNPAPESLMRVGKLSQLPPPPQLFCFQPTFFISFYLSIHRPIHLTI